LNGRGGGFGVFGDACDFEDPEFRLVEKSNGTASSSWSKQSLLLRFIFELNVTFCDTFWRIV